MVPTVLGECLPERGEACWTSADGFRTLHPSPVNAHLRDVLVMPDGEVWIVGDDGTLLRIVRGDNGERRVTPIEVPDTPTLASSLDAIDGSNTTESEFPGSSLMKLSFKRIVGQRHDHVFVAMGDTYVSHWDGARWDRHRRDGLAGGAVMMLHPDGRLWTTGGVTLFGKQHPLLLDPERLGASGEQGPLIASGGQLQALAVQREVVWAAGDDGALFRSLEGSSFEAVPMPHPDEDYRGLWLDPDGEDGALVSRKHLYTRSGAGFTHAADLKSPPTAVHGFAGGPIWVVGDHAHRFEGGALTRVPIDGFQPPDTNILSFGATRLEAVHGRAPDDVWMVGRAGMILHFNGKRLSELAPRLTESDIVGLAWTGPDSWVAAAEDGTLIRGSLSSAHLEREKGPLDAPRRLTQTRAGELILAGCRKDMFVLTASGAWSKLPPLDACVRDVHGLDKEHLWAVGSRDLIDGKAWRLHNGKWEEVATGMGEHDELRDVEVGHNGDVWLAGYQAILLAKGGKKLARIQTHAYDDYRHVAVREPDDVWIATNANDIGSAGTLLHWDGTKLTRFDRLTANFLSSVVALPSGAVWAFGLGGVATFSPDGKTFRPAATGCSVLLDQALAHTSGALLVGGDFGTLLHRKP